jgi:hypothetical protein
MLRKKSESKHIVIDITCPQGNAFYLLGVASSLSKQLGYSAEEIRTEMKSGDYDNLLQVFEKYFGELVILEY